MLEDADRDHFLAVVNGLRDDGLSPQQLFEHPAAS
jgi:hypothetical protein